jgi:hypothetical protein
MVLTGFVKYSPSGWVLARSDGAPRPKWRMGTALWLSRPWGHGGGVHIHSRN